MGTHTIYEKTPLGTQEVAQRKVKMAPRLRMMLILVDGETPEGTLLEEARKIGAPEDCLAQLTALGMIKAAAGEAASATSSVRPRVSPAQRFTAAKEFMTATASSTMGLRAFLFILKLEKASTVEDLRALAPDFVEGLRKAAGEEEARILGGRLERLLA